MADCSQNRQSAKINSPPKFPAIRYICMVVCIYVRTSTAGTHSFFQPARHFINCILVLAGLLPLLPVGRAPGGHATHVHTYIHTYVRVYDILTHINCDTAIVSHLVIRLSDSLSLIDCLCSSSTLACRSVNSSLVCRSCPSSAYVCMYTRARTYRQATCTYVRTYVHSCAHSFVIRMLYMCMHTCTYVHMHVQYVRMY